MTIEYGLFSDEGAVETGFYSKTEAEAAITDRYTEDDGLEVLEVCPDHADESRLFCEKCHAEEEAEDEDDESDDDCDE